MPPPSPTIEAVVIASSTGGPNALQDVLSGLPAAWPVPVFVVQHMPVHFMPMLAQRLAARCALPVVLGEHDGIVRPGVVTLAPGGHHLALERYGGMVRLALTDGPPENACRPAADVLFRTAAAVYGAHALGVVLTGMGYDGLVGCRALHAQGARILAQDEATSVVWGMPGAVANAGLATRVLPIAQIAPEIVRCVLNQRPA